MTAAPDTRLFDRRKAHTGARIRLRAGCDPRWLLALLLAVLVLAGTAAGCGSSANDTGTSVTTEPSTTAAQATVTMTDQAGRQLTIPATIDDVWCTSPIGTNLMFTLAPEMLVGWNVTPTAVEKEFIPEKYRSVTGMGGWYGKNTTGNVEEIIKRAPDVILDIGVFDQSFIDDANRIQELLNIPVIMVDGSLDKTAETYRYLGKLLHQEERAKELAQYSERILERAEEIRAKIPESERIAVYYAEGAKGLNTDPEGSQHTEVLGLAGALNIAQVPEEESGYGMSPVSLEQVIAWDPHVILVASDLNNENQAWDNINTLREWSTITAVKNGRVYQIPRGPFDWFDRPPCVARILGVEWIGNLLYPELWQLDIVAEVKEFYKIFFHTDLTDEQLNTLMARALPGAAENPATTGSATATTAVAVAADYHIEVKGLLDNPMKLTTADLQKMNVVEITTEHPKLGTQTYRGVRFSDLLPLFKLQAGATVLDITCVDGFIAEVAVADIQATPDALLAIDKDGTMDLVMPGMHGKAWARDAVTFEFR